jgi:hypothetical protein
VKKATFDERAEKLGLETSILNPQSMSHDELEVKRRTLSKHVSRTEQAPEKKVEEQVKDAQRKRDEQVALKAKAVKEKAALKAKAQRKRNMDDARKAHDQIGMNWLAAEQRALPDSYFPGVSGIHMRCLVLFLCIFTSCHHAALCQVDSKVDLTGVEEEFRAVASKHFLTRMPLQPWRVETAASTPTSVPGIATKHSGALTGRTQRALFRVSLWVYCYGVFSAENLVSMGPPLQAEDSLAVRVQRKKLYGTIPKATIAKDGTALLFLNSKLQTAALLSVRRPTGSASARWCG